MTEKKDDIADLIFKETLMWRIHFLDTLLLNGPYKYISEEDKIKLRALFENIPSSIFTDPWKCWHDCVSTLLQDKEAKK